MRRAPRKPSLWQIALWWSISVAYNHSPSSPEVGCLFVLLALGELNQSFRPTDIASPSGRLFSHCLKGLITELAQTDRFALVSDSPVPRALFPETRGRDSSLRLSPALIWKGGWVMWEIECPASYRWQLITTETALSWHQHSSPISGRKIERMKVVAGV